jgi:hypothetical protein
MIKGIELPWQLYVAMLEKHPMGFREGTNGLQICTKMRSFLLLQSY